MQDGHTSQMIFRVPETIAYISSVVTLEPGDIIAMGTPDGVGSARGLSLKAGDRVRCEVEHIGSLETEVV
jgi:2,4-diketo-3-deoxy-L-fuconate hydrolase